MTRATLSQRILYGLPATVGELAGIEGTTVHVVNATLCQLRQQGLVRLSDRVGLRNANHGRVPRIWERVR